MPAPLPTLLPPTQLYSPQVIARHKAKLEQEEAQRQREERKRLMEDRWVARVVGARLGMQLGQQPACIFAASSSGAPLPGPPPLAAILYCCLQPEGRGPGFLPAGLALPLLHLQRRGRRSGGAAGCGAALPGVRSGWLPAGAVVLRPAAVS